MSLIWPQMLALFILIPLLVIAYIIALRRRNRYALRYSSLSLVKEAIGRGPRVRRHVSPFLYLTGLAFMIFATARPVAVATLPSEEGTVIMTIDVSGSMAADDVKPTRMDAAKAAARAFVEHQPQGVRIGIVSFSDEPALLQAPTTDRDAILTAIGSLEPDRGTAIGSAIRASLEAILSGPKGDSASNSFASANASPTPSDPAMTLPKGTFAAATIILLTDGENTEGPDPLAVAQEAANQGVRVYTIGLGTPEGAVLNIQGMSVRTSLDESTLQSVATVTGGTYSNAVNEDELRAVYDKLGARLVLKTEKTEVTAGFTALAAIFSIVASAISLLWFNRLP